MSKPVLFNKCIRYFVSSAIFMPVIIEQILANPWLTYKTYPGISVCKAPEVPKRMIFGERKPGLSSTFENRYWQAFSSLIAISIIRANTIG